MRSLSELLKNHPIPGIRESENRRVCCEAIKKMIGVPVAPGKVRVQNGILSLSIPPIVKSALLMQQQEFFKLLNDQNIHITEIR